MTVNHGLNDDPAHIEGADSNGEGTGKYLDFHIMHGFNCVPAIVLPVEMFWTHDEKAFICTYEWNQPNLAERASILIKNPSGSTIDVYFGRMTLDVLTKGGQATYRLYKNPTVTSNGSALAISQLRVGGSYTGQALAYTIPTVTANGTRIMSISCGKDSNSMLFDFKFGMELEPNNSILITTELEANNRNLAFSLWFAESGD